MSEPKERILQVAQRLLVQHGYGGLRFADIADDLGITRASIHYHFGSKQALVELIVSSYLEDTLRRFEKIWTDPGLSYAQKVHGTAAYNYWRFKQYNDKPGGTRPWNFIDRLRGDANLINSDSARSALLVSLNAYVHGAIRLAQSRQELLDSAPVEDIAVQITSIIDCAGSITLQRGGYPVLESLYRAHLRTVIAAYGTDETRARDPAWAAIIQ